MANKHVKRCSISLVIRELQVKTTMKCHVTPTKMSIKKRKEALARMHLVGGSVAMENSLAGLQSVKQRTTNQLSNSTLRYIPRRTKNKFSNKYMYKHIPSSTILNSQRGKQLKYPSMGESMNKLW